MERARRIFRPPHRARYSRFGKILDLARDASLFCPADLILLPIDEVSPWLRMTCLNVAK
jgi:hypothetical protein